MKVYGGMEVNFHAFLTSVTNEGEWSASCFRFTPRKKDYCTLWMGSSVDPRVILDISVKKNANITVRN
jgi:hypothetical protein